MKLLNKIDFNCIGDVVKHCDLPKLCIAEDEAINFDLNSLFCGFWLDILQYWKEVDDYDADPESEKPTNYEEKKNLIYGGTFEGCNNRTSNHLGIKRALIYYAYSRYILVNSSNDTPNGKVTKDNEFTIPKTVNDLKFEADRYRTMGYESYKQTVNFICNNKTIYPDFNHKDCAKCGCSCDKCNGRTKAKGYGFKSTIVRR